MTEYANEIPNQNDCNNPAVDYINKAANACAAGDLQLGVHLYLAAYEKASADDGVPASVAVTALREAWGLACDMKERSLAEYVFEKLEPYLTGEEIAECAGRLQELALERLEQYGFSREELADMADAISQDFLGEGAHVVKVESVSIPNMGMFGVPDTAVEAAVVEKAPSAQAASDAGQDITPEPPQDAGSSDAMPDDPAQPQLSIADVNDWNPYDYYATNSVGTSYHAATNEGSGSYVFTRDEDRAKALEHAREADEAAKAAGAAGAVAEVSESAQDESAQDEPAQDEPANAQAGAEQANNEPAPEPSESKVDLAAVASSMVAGGDAVRPATYDDGVLRYGNLAGYDKTIAIMHDLGVGVKENKEFNDFVRMLNLRHGLDRMPAVDTLLFRAPALEDATRFVDATAGELGLPVLRMTMEEGMGGAPVLCVTTQGNNRPRMNHAHNRFEGPGILIIDDLDMWTVPEAPEGAEGFGGFMMANISRGAREAVNLIRSAVEDPDVFVLATASTMGNSDPFFYELLEPITIVDIGYPSESERADIWEELAEDHPSIRLINRDDLVRFSEGLARYDIYMATREAVEDAYKMGLVQRTYLPVTPQNLFDKLAACQPLDSQRYHELEQAIIDDFRNDLDHLEDLLGGRE